jgi:antitoxin HicB
MLYPVKLTRDGPFFMASFPDIPEALTQGDTREDALAHAADALETALDHYLEAGIPVPAPSAPRRSQPVVALRPLAAAKALLHNELLAQKVRPAELARRLHMPRQNVNRLLDRRHSTSIDSLASALAVLGKQLEVTIR